MKSKAIEVKGKEKVQSNKRLKCFKYDELGHKSNKLPIREFINIIRLQEEEEKIKGEVVRREFINFSLKLMV